MSDQTRVLSDQFDGTAMIDGPDLMHTDYCPACGTHGNTGIFFSCGTAHIGMELVRGTRCFMIAHERDMRIDDEIAAANAKIRMLEDAFQTFTLAVGHGLVTRDEDCLQAAMDAAMKIVKAKETGT